MTDLPKPSKEQPRKCPRHNVRMYRGYGVEYRGRWVCVKCNPTALKKCGKCGDLVLYCAC